MAGIFEIALVNPIRFLPKDETDIFLINQDDKCYFQKWQTSDSTKLQILSDFPDIVCELRNFDTDELVQTLVVTEQTTNILNQTFKCYEIDIEFLTIDPGRYYFYIAYTDTILYEFYSEPQSVEVDQYNTLLINYTNSQNNYSVVFDTGIEFNFRVEGTIKEFTPVSDDVIYNDQLRNATLLDSVPYRSFKLFIGGNGVPDWVTDKINRIFSCDQKKIDGDYYEKIEGQKIEVNRPDEYAFSTISIEIMPVENLFLQRLRTGNQPPEGFTVVELVKNFYANSGNLTVADVFRKYSLLKHISFINYGAEFSINIGTTDGGDEIGSFNIPSGASTLTLEWLFIAPSTVYISGTSSNTDVLFDYLQYDALPATPAPTTPPAVGIGSVIIYEMPDAQLAIDFNLGTGLGNTGTDWFGWAVCDGRNGTVDRGGKFSVGYKSGDPDYGAIGDLTGADTVTLVKANIPPLPTTITFGLDKRGSIGSDALWSNLGSDGSKSFDPGGTSVPFKIIPPAIVSLYVKKIA